jgi:hypothetical protein
VAQVLFGQQGCSAWPHAAQVPVELPPPLWQTLPGEQVADPPVPTPLQQGWVAPPQDTHVAVPPADEAALQTVFGAVQRLVLQHGSPTPPQLPHAPSVQVPVMVLLQVCPAALQVEVPPPPVDGTQHPPSRQMLPGQQVSPDPPHDWQPVG